MVSTGGRDDSQAAAAAHVKSPTSMPLKIIRRANREIRTELKPLKIGARLIRMHGWRIGMGNETSAAASFVHATRTNSDPLIRFKRAL